ncbi:histone-lysine N-methyltransferase eggless isoform X2 [Aethina tumida]|uniref:histone-lysine N-methyltransferase eggless isoform X2 n=1 Tax=Aethina tumida TaxID=116153 RepID=UPI002147DC57|nr:histone-lysine N-methyltransferase eggless isoform X2 [Aethina tumida]
MQEDEDLMEIDDTIHNAPIIEQKPLELNTPVSSKQGTNDVVVLDDDEEEGAKQLTPINNNETIIDLIQETRRCINSSCEGKTKDYIIAPDFCLIYYKVKPSKNIVEEICHDCYTQAVIAYDKLAMNAAEGKCVLSVNLPLINETLQIDDSDEEDGNINDLVEYIDEESAQFIKDNLDLVIDEALNKYDIESLAHREVEFVEDSTLNIENQISEISFKVKDLRQSFDTIQIDLYKKFSPNGRELKGLTIIDDFSCSSGTITRYDSAPPKPTVQKPPNPQQKPLQQQPAQSAIRVTTVPGTVSAPSRKSARHHKPVSYAELDDPGNADSPRVTDKLEELAEKIEPPPGLPNFGPMEKPPAKQGDIYYVVREQNPSGPWIRARLSTSIPVGQEVNGNVYDDVHYRLTELKQQRDRIVNGKQIAYMTPSSVRLVIGTRVLAMFTEETKKQNHPYYPGIVGESPHIGNKYRYLIFFDIGYAQYVNHENVHLIFESSKNVWEDMKDDSRSFIKKYIESQDRPMVKLAKDQTVRVEYNGKWWLCTVKHVDCSLATVHFEHLNRTETIYRGSMRLSPMFREEQAATNRHSGIRASRKAGPNESATVVQYRRTDEYPSTIVDDSPTKENDNPVRAVARKSTTPRPLSANSLEHARPFLPPLINTALGPTSKIMYFTPRDQMVTQRRYLRHPCGPACRRTLTHNFSKLRGHNPLSKPLLCGWARLTSRARGRKEIVYKTPCGRILRSIAEVHCYLRVTQSEMTVDLFDFNHMVRCLAEFNVDCKPDPADLSKDLQERRCCTNIFILPGLEQVPIPVINGVNNDMLDFCHYSTKRVPMEGVHINCEPEFLCGCDCEDDCIDKTKCSCWKLTLEGAKYLGKDVDPNSVGYIYRRLQDQVITGIYECNSRCKCGPTCLNRVVQNPMSLKLQVFRTHNRGWGIRSLNDVPQGTFICIYAGTLHTEAMANEDGMAYGDEYFAELDYIETVEKYKEDYEAEVLEDEEDEDLDDATSKTSKSGGRLTPDFEEEEIMRGVNAKNRRYSDDNDFVCTTKVAGQETGIRTRLRRRNDDDKDTKDPKDAKDSKEVKNTKEVKESKEMKNTKDMKDSKEVKDVKDTKDIKDAKVKEPVVIKQEVTTEINMKAIESLQTDIDTVTISDDEDEGREVLSFNPKSGTTDLDEKSKYNSVRDLFGPNEEVYIMDAKTSGNIGRFLNHSCSPNVFVQNVFVDTQDPRFPWVAFFSSQFIRAGTELTWNYNYDIGSVPGRVLYCHCGSLECKGRLL